MNECNPVTLRCRKDLEGLVDKTVAKIVSDSQKVFDRCDAKCQRVSLFVSGTSYGLLQYSCTSIKNWITLHQSNSVRTLTNQQEHTVRYNSQPGLSGSIHLSS